MNIARAFNGAQYANDLANGLWDLIPEITTGISTSGPPLRTYALTG
ncbi:hypothetical protein [Streptomyces sp. NBC_00154]|nr:hypothetical protein [Streptomyces sp. NBC_00154]MCX5316920.1 hypothetical protein [Streptomyces sp. NBC_00154]